MDKRLIVIIASASLLVIVVILIFVFGRVVQPPALVSGELTFWGVFDDKNDVWKDMLREFNDAHPNIEITYEKKPIANYEADILNQLALREKLDLFMVNNMWMPRYSDKIYTLPDSAVSARGFQDSFADVAMQDFVDEEGNILGVPLYSDTLALYYNKDYFNQANIAIPPATWDEFASDSKKLAVVDEFNNIVRAGAAFGAADNVNRAPDILSLLMMQGGAEMVDMDKGEAAFGKNMFNQSDGQSATSNPGLRALEFYTEFTNPLKSVYTWGEGSNFHYSIDAFADGTAAMMINYAYHKQTILDKSPNLNFGIAKMPQIAGNDQVDYANYFGVVMSNTVDDQNLEAAQTFMAWLASEDAQRLYVDLSAKSPIHKVLIKEKIGDANLGVFAQQALTARSWYQADNREVDAAFNDMIKSVVRGKVKAKDALMVAVDRITRSIRNQ